MENGTLYSEARNEYLKQMSTWIVPPLVEFFRKEYNSLLEAEGKKVMSAFQTYCSQVPLWNQDVIDSNIGIILDNCRCDYMEELMTAVFIAYTKMLTAIRVNSRQKKLQITLPKLDHFLHRVFIECARSFWKAPYLFAHDLPPIEKQKNILQAEQICTEALSGAVRSLLPVKSILRDYLDDGDEDKDEKETEKETEDKEEEDDDDELKEDKVAETAKTDEDVKVEELKVETVKELKVEEVKEPKVEEVKEPKVELGKVEDIKEVKIEHTIEPSKDIKSVSIVETPKIIAEMKAVEEDKPKEEPKVPVSIEKLETPPAPPTIQPSPHLVTDVAVPQPLINISKQDAEPAAVVTPAALVGGGNAVANLMIDTEPSVHFTPYDTVFDETTQGISHIRYSPKDGENDDYAPPRLSFGTSANAIATDDVEDLEPTARVAKAAVAEEPDIDAPLGSTDDFEVLA